jgi:hypothetical protein
MAWIAGLAAAAAVSDSMTGATYSENSWRVNLAEVMKEARTSRK